MSATKFDKLPGSGVQPHSRGEIFPLVIARTERYVSPHVLGVNVRVHVDTFWNVLNAGADAHRYDSYDEAFLAAALITRASGLPKD